MILFKDKTLNFAIILSIIWHFILFCTIFPYFASFSGKTYGRTIISFLGAILNEVTPEKRDFGENLENFDTKRSSLVDISLERPQPFSRPIFFEKEEGIVYDKKFIELRKIPLKIDSTLEEVINMPELEISGEAKGRELVYKPKLPIYPKSLFLEDIPYEIRLRFFVSPGGEVLAVEKLTSSGSAVVDEVGYRYVKGLKFLPLKKEFSDKLDEGIIALRF